MAQTSVLFETIPFAKDRSMCEGLIKRLAAFTNPDERQAFTEQMLILLQFPDMTKEVFFELWDLAYKVPAHERGTFLEPLAEIILELTQHHRRNVVQSLARVQGDNLLPFVRFLVDHQVRDMTDISTLSFLSNPADWLPRLQNFRWARGYTIPEVSITQVYNQLDRHPVRINRESLKQWQLPEISSPTYTAPQMLQSLQTLVNSLNLTDPTRPDYLSVSLVREELLPRSGAENRQAFITSILPKLSGFFKTLWDLPLRGMETGGWQMYDEQKPALQQALSYILNHMNQADTETKMMQFVQVAQGLLHCPTGQKEAVDSVVQSLLNQSLVSAETFQQKFEQFLALKKHEAFRQAIVPGDHAQNVHILSFYHEKLRDTLGLSSVLGNYQERFGHMSNDPFGGYKGNALQAFYNRLTPAYLSNLLHSHTQTKQDFALRQHIDSVREALRKEKSEPQKEALKTTLASLKQTYQRIIKFDRPFNPLDIYNDLVSRGKLATDTTQGWQRYFSDDPLLSTDSFELTPAGAQQYLIDIGILLAN